jgi:hypothetical protein
MNDVEKLLAIEEIKLLRHRWSRYVDEASWAAIADLLAPDAELDLTATRRRALAADAPELPPVRGAEAICRWLESNLSGMPEQLHVVTMPEITFVSDSEAEGVWRQQSFIPGAQGRGGKCGLGFGTIRDTYAKVDGRWLMRRMGVSVELVL